MDVVDIPTASVAASIVQIDEYAVGREQSTVESSNGGDNDNVVGICTVFIHLWMQAHLSVHMCLGAFLLSIARFHIMQGKWDGNTVSISCC